MLDSTNEKIHKLFFERKIMREGRRFDTSLLWMTMLMTAFSLLMIYSASIATAVSGDGGQFGYVGKQFAFVCVGVLCCTVLWCFVSIGRLKKIVPVFFVLSLLLLVTVLFSGRLINGATRWIHIGPINVQPSEVFKLAVILYLASLFTRREAVLRSMDAFGWRSIFRGIGNLLMFPFSVDARHQTKRMWFEFKTIILPILLVAVGLGLLMRQPDFGSFVVIAVITIGMLFLAGFPWKYFILLVGSVLLVMIPMIVFEPYRLKRVSGFLDPWGDANDTGYQLTQSLMAIGRGKWFGTGLGESISKRAFLPEAHTDFIFAIIGEEFGFVGMFVLVSCYGWLVVRALSIGKQARDLGLMFNAHIANGIGIWLGIQSFFNIGVNTGILPTKGLTLPLISYGGSAVIIMLVCMTLLLRIDYENRRKMSGVQQE